MNSISVLIPTYNNGKTINKCIESIKNQTKKADEIIIIDGHSKDNTVEIAKLHGCKILYEEKGSRAAACNVGIPEAKGEIIVFIDGDAIAKEDWLEKIVEAFEKEHDRKVVCVTGPNIEYPNETVFGKAVSAVYGTFLGGKWTEHIESIFNRKKRYVESAAGCNSAYKKDILNEVMPFNERLITAEDTDINYKLRKKGYAIFFEPDAIVFHQRPQNHKAYRKKAQKYAMGKIQFFREHSSGLEIGHILPPFYFITGFFSLFLIISNYWISVGVAVYFSLYLTTVLSLTLLQTLKYKQWRFLYLLPIMFLEGHLWWSYGIVKEVFLPYNKKT